MHRHARLRPEAWRLAAIALVVATTLLGLLGAAPASAAPITFGLESLGGNWAGQQMAAVGHNGRLDVFLVGRDRQLYHLWQRPEDGGGFQRESLGGSWPGGMVRAVSRGPGRWDVFIDGRDANIYHYWYPHWEPSGPTFGLESWGNYGAAYPSLAATATPGRLDLFAVTSQGVLHFWQLDGQPPAWEPLHLDWWDRPSFFLDAVSSRPGRLDLFVPTFDVRDSGVHVMHYWQDGGSWWGREDPDDWPRVDFEHPAQPGPITAVSWGSPRVDFFTGHHTAGGSDLAVYHSWQDNAPFQTEWLGGIWPSYFAATAGRTGRLDLFSVGTDSRLYHYWQG